MSQNINYLNFVVNNFMNWINFIAGKFKYCIVTATTIARCCIKN